MRYQLLPPLTDDEYAALKADVAEKGVLVPVVKDQHGNTLDGHDRLRAVDELRAEGVDVADPPTVRVDCASEADARDRAVKLNLLRRQVGPVTWARLFRNYAAEKGVELGQGKRNDRTSATVAEVAAEVGVSARTARRRLRIADRLAEHPDVAEKVDRGAMDVKRAERVVRERDAVEQRRKAAEEIEQLKAAAKAGEHPEYGVRVREITVADGLRQAAEQFRTYFRPHPPRDYPVNGTSVQTRMLTDHERNYWERWTPQFRPHTDAVDRAIVELEQVAAEYDEAVADALASAGAAAKKARASLERIARQVESTPASDAVIDRKVSYVSTRRVALTDDDRRALEPLLGSSVNLDGGAA